MVGSKFFTARKLEHRKALNYMMISCIHNCNLIAGLIESRGYGDRIRVTRTGRSRHPAVASITLSERAKQAHAIEHEGSLNKLKFSIGETKKVIQGLRHSLEDQLTELPLAVKRKYVRIS